MEEKPQEVNYNRIIIGIAVLLTLVVGVIYVTPKIELTSVDLSFLPMLNAGINSTVSVLLIIGFWHIKNGNRKAHKRAMTSAIVLSALFLISYVAYHTTHESTAFGGDGTVRYVYFFLLLTHIILAIVIVPLVLISFTRALSERFDKHRRIARITFPLWLYVSISGVVVYLMISPYY